MGMDICTSSNIPLSQQMELNNNTSSNFSGFEGVEKRLEVGFRPLKISQVDGLRSLNHKKIDNLLKLAECNIVSELHNNIFDSYVLSESSLFIYPHKMVLKTCGKTQLLKCISLLLNYAAKLYLDPCYCKYTHGTFTFPQQQPYPYASFKEEVKCLDIYFGHMGSKAHTIGTEGGQNWHIYTAATHDYNKMMNGVKPIFTLEMCMTNLDKEFASHFYNPNGTKTGKVMTRESKIDHILPNASLCDYAFAPCGYSMNGLEECALSTIHITPEEAHSYASFEIMGYDPHCLELEALVDKVLSTFKPTNVIMSMHVLACHDNLTKMIESGNSLGFNFPPNGYGCEFSQRNETCGPGVVLVHTFSRDVKNTKIPKQLLVNSTENETIQLVSDDESSMIVNNNENANVGCSKQHEVGQTLRTCHKTKIDHDTSSFLQKPPKYDSFDMRICKIISPYEYKIENSDSEEIQYIDSDDSSFTSNVNLSGDERSDREDMED